MDEFNIIRNCFAPLSEKEKGAFSLQDDAAMLQIPDGLQLVVTKDAIVEGVHFIGDESPAQIAAKLLRVNLSDLAAMGAKPYGYFLAFIIPSSKDEVWIKNFAAGLRSEQETFGLTLMGGDTTRTPGPLTLSLTMLGLTSQGKILRRNGAAIDDNIYVTGTIGDAALGLHIAKSGKILSHEDAYLLERYRLPLPRLAVGEALHGIATACMDISDGLMQDLGHIATYSNVAALLHWDKIPLSTAAQNRPVVPQEILTGGDDYELLFTAPPHAHDALQELARKTAINIMHIGKIKAGSGVKVIDRNGNDIYVSKHGYNHFTAAQ